MGQERRHLVEKELVRLRGEGVKLDRDWRRLPWLLTSIVLLVPTYLLWGPIAAIYGFLCVPALYATGAYLVGVRRSENDQLMAELEQQIAGWDAAEAELSSELA